MRERFSIDRTPRTSDLYAMVQQLGATITNRPAGTLHGVLEQAEDCLPNSWQVSIDKTMPSHRFRFVLSHELGHLYLRHNNLNPTSEERWCNEFAAELLMPHAHIQSEFRNAKPNLETVRDLARNYDVSRSAAVVRLRRVLSWQRGFISLRLRSDGWSVTQMTAIPHIALYQLEPVSAPHHIPERTTFQTWLQFAFKSQLIEILSECDRRGSRVDAFINTSDLNRVCAQIVKEIPKVPSGSPPIVEMYRPI